MINKLTRFCVAQLLSGSHWAFKFSLRIIKTMYTGTLFIKICLLINITADSASTNLKDTFEKIRFVLLKLGIDKLFACHVVSYV